MIVCIAHSTSFDKRVGFQVVIAVRFDLYGLIVDCSVAIKTIVVRLTVEYCHVLRVAGIFVVGQGLIARQVDYIVHLALRIEVLLDKTDPLSIFPRTNQHAHILEVILEGSPESPWTSNV